MERIYRKLTDVRQKHNKIYTNINSNNLKKDNSSIDCRENNNTNVTSNIVSYAQTENNSEIVPSGHSSKSSVFVPDVDLVRQASYSSSHTTAISNTYSDFANHKSPSVSYIPVTTLGSATSFTSLQYNNTGGTECSQERNLKSTSYIANVRKNSVDPKTRKQMLSRNNYYNDKILRTLLRSQSNTQNNSPKKVGSTYRLAVQKSNSIMIKKPNSTYYDNGDEKKRSVDKVSSMSNLGKSSSQYRTYHNMPIQSKITKGINKVKSKLHPYMNCNAPQTLTRLPPRSVFNSEISGANKLQTDLSPRVTIMNSEFKPASKSRIIPTSNFAISNTAYTRQ